MISHYRVFFWLLLGALACILGCETEVHVATNATRGEQRTGPVTVVDVSVGECMPSTSVCNRTLTLKSDSGAIYQLGLERSDAWPPVWKGMRADIHFKKCDACATGANVILWVQELK
jgi:hypothetical protein